MNAETTSKGRKKKKKKKHSGGSGKPLADTASFCRSGIRPTDTLRVRVETFFNAATVKHNILAHVTPDTTQQRIQKLVQKYGTAGDEAGLVLELRRSFHLRKVAGYFNCTRCPSTSKCTSGRMSTCVPGYTPAGPESLPCDYEEYKRARCKCVKDTAAQKSARDLMSAVVHHLQQHASSQLCNMRRRGYTNQMAHAVFLHEISQLWIDEVIVMQSLVAKSSADARRQTDWEFAIRSGVSNGLIKRRDGRLVLQSEISAVVLPLWCQLHLGLILERAEVAVLGLVSLFALALGRSGVYGGRSISHLSCRTHKRNPKDTGRDIHSVLGLWARSSMLVRLTSMVVMLCQVLMAGLLLSGRSLTTAENCSFGYRVLCPALLILCAAGGMVQFRSTNTATFAPRFRARSAQARDSPSPFASAADGIECFPWTCLLPNWISLIFFGCFASVNNAVNVGQTTTAGRGRSSFLPCLVTEMRENVFSPLRWSLMVQPLIFLFSLCLAYMIRGRDGQSGWILRTSIASASVLSGTAVLVRPLTKALSGIAVMYDQGIYSAEATPLAFTEELGVEALLLLAITFTALHGICLILLVSVVNVRYLSFLLAEVLPLLSARTDAILDGMTENELADMVSDGDIKDRGLGEAVQCLCDLEWLCAAVRDDATGGGVAKTRWFSIPGGRSSEAPNSVASLQSRFRAGGGTSSFFLPLFSEQVHPNVQMAQLSFWRQYFTGAEWRGKRLRVDRALTACGRVLAETVARNVFHNEGAGEEHVLEGWWEGSGETTFHFFSRSITSWGEVLRQEHENIINPGRSDNVCTAGELEETLAEFKSLPRQAKWKVLHGLVAQGIAKLDLTGDVSDTGIIWRKH